MKRYFLQLAYNGSTFFGWQIQPEQISIQETIEQCLSKLHSNEVIKITGCGRTDTGVHAHDYFAHVDLPQTDIDKLVFKLNKMLPDTIAIKAGFEVEPEKHARFDATERVYRYFVHTQKDPFLSDRSLLVKHPLNFEAMNEAAESMIGKKDFTSFSKIHTDVKTNICDVRSAKWVQTSDSSYYFEISADRFLRNMVRATVGTLIDVGMGKLQPKDIDKILTDMDRQSASKSVAAHGLFLWEIKY
jgi:tRNA pseudouridine38-40 synthase